MTARWMRWLSAPLDDYMAAVESFAGALDVRVVLAGLVAVAVSWWVYVPTHELLHAWGCWVGGGEVTRLEIDAIYGAAYLQRIFPFVAVGSEYAGQLTGFDTGGNDFIYLLTDLAPFFLTIALGVPALVAVPRITGAVGRAIALGGAVPVAFAPFISLTGDYYEMGAILVSRVAHALCGVPLDRWRGDDALLIASEVAGTGARAGDWAGIGASLVCGAVLAWSTYGAGRLVAARVVSGADTSV